MFVRIVALVDALVRRLAQQMATLLVVAPRAVGGFDQAAMERPRTEARAAARTIERPIRGERRTAVSKIKLPHVIGNPIAAG
jgi:hypothetical protein